MTEPLPCDNFRGNPSESFRLMDSALRAINRSMLPGETSFRLEKLEATVDFIVDGVLEFRWLSWEQKLYRLKVEFTCHYELAPNRDSIRKPTLNNHAAIMALDEQGEAVMDVAGYFYDNEGSRSGLAHLWKELREHYYWEMLRAKRILFDDWETSEKRKRIMALESRLATRHMEERLPTIDLASLSEGK